MSWYRSEDEKILLGVCGGIADKYDLNKTWTRSLTVIIASMTAGLLIPFYLLGFLLPARSTKEKTKTEDYLMKAIGIVKQLKLYENKIKIETKDSFWARLDQRGEGVKEIPLEEITSIELKKPKRAPGHIKFGQSGVPENEADSKNTLSFKRNFEKFEDIKEKIHQLRNNGHSSDRSIQRLKERFAEGEIDEEEFERKKELLED